MGWSQNWLAIVWVFSWVVRIFLDVFREVRSLSASEGWVFLSTGFQEWYRWFSLVEGCFPRDRVWWSSSSFAGVSEFSLWISEPYFWNELSSLCLCPTSYQSWAAKAVWSVSLDGRSKFGSLLCSDLDKYLVFWIELSVWITGIHCVLRISEGVRVWSISGFWNQ